MITTSVAESPSSGMGGGGGGLMVLDTRKHVITVCDQVMFKSVFSATETGYNGETFPVASCITVLIVERILWGLKRLCGWTGLLCAFIACMQQSQVFSCQGQSLL